MDIFLDSSALIKRYLPEQGTRWIRSMLAEGIGNHAIIAQITPVEVISGVSRRKREGYISPNYAHTIRQLLERHVRETYVGVGVTEQILWRAADLLETHALRAYDAVQLASALDSNDRLVAAGLPALVFVSADKHLLDAAASEGLHVEDPNTHT